MSVYCGVGTLRFRHPTETTSSNVSAVADALASAIINATTAVITAAADEGEVAPSGDGAADEGEFFSPTEVTGDAGNFVLLVSGLTITGMFCFGVVCVLRGTGTLPKPMRKLCCTF